MAVLLEGKSLAEKIRVGMLSEVNALKAKCGAVPKLIALQVGESASTAVYVRSQKKAADSLGIGYELKALPEATSQAALEKLISDLNRDSSVTAIILQCPVPGHIDPKKTIGMILPSKDAEGMHPENLGKILLGKNVIAPCTASAVMELLACAGVELYGKEAVIVGHSEIVGRPLSLLMLNKFATTTVCHIATGQRGALAAHVGKAEVLVVAVGKAGIIKGEWVKEGAIVIDVGINSVDGKLVGDVEFDEAFKRADKITPVPGGIGPLTTMILMRNTIEQFRMQHQDKI